MRRARPAILALFLAGCAGDRHDQKVEAAVEHEAREHHAHHASDHRESDDVGRDLLEDAESGPIGGPFRAILDATSRRDDRGGPGVPPAGIPATRIRTKRRHTPRLCQAFKPRPDDPSDRLKDRDDQSWTRRIKAASASSSPTTRPTCAT